MGDEQKTLIELLKSDPATQGVAAAGLALIYKFIRILKADSREDSIQKQVDRWHDEMVKEVAELRERVDTMASENAGLQVKVAELTMTVKQLQLHNSYLIRKLKTYEPNPELTFPYPLFPSIPPMARTDKVWIDELGQYLTIPTGELGVPTTGSTPAADTSFRITSGGVGRVRFALPSTATASETVTLTWYLRDGTTATASSTLAVDSEEDWPINTLGLDYLTWSSTGSAATLETL